jgi:asparagine synthetase B (glutamine-hydrolysing)
VDRIHTRNLGRDDRIIASHGKEARYPYLSLSLIAFLSDLPIHFKVDPRVMATSNQDEDMMDSNEMTSKLTIAGLPGDKVLHRLAARQLKLEGAARRAKRAMQFGSRSARMEGGEGNKKIKGSASLNPN